VSGPIGGVGPAGGERRTGVSAEAGPAPAHIEVPRTTPRMLLALREVVLLGGLLLAYSAIRLAAVDDRGIADRHATAVLGLEQVLHLDVESAVNSALAQLPPLEVFASYWYAALHYTVTPLALVLVYRLRPRQYRRMRAALLLPTAVALIGYVAFPTAPPRLLGGYIDTLLATADFGWWSGEGSAVRGAASAVNQFAAMPSMHVGWALWCSLVFWQLARGRLQRVLAASYAPGTALVVIGTGNHWVLDVVAGAVLVAVAWWVAVGRDRPSPAPEPAP
jgi:membrane-associated phospholipid phosphatase